MNGNIKRISALLASLILMLSTLSGCARKKIYTDTSFDYFDTFCTFSAVADSEDEFNVYKDIFLSTLREYHTLLDIYNEYDGINNLKTLNDNAGNGELTVDAALYDFLSFGKEMHDLTDGHTNIAMGSVLKLWHEAREISSGTNAEPTLPSEEKISDALLHTDISSLCLLDGSSVSISDPHVSIDAGAVGKGYVTDKLAEKLKNAGCGSFLINLGGNVYAYGVKPGDESWLAGIENPSDSGGFRGSVALNGLSLVTSGSYQRYITVDGKIYHHIIDHKTGYPEDHFLSVSVLCSESSVADALSTALFCMNETDGRALIDTISDKDIEVLWLYSNGHVSTTDGFYLYAVATDQKQ